jgi:hypothetical protein
MIVGERMETRTKRYSDLDVKAGSRTARNQNLYKSIYEDTEYTNIEGITNIGRTNRIDVRTIQAMLKEEKEPLPKRSAVINNDVKVTEEPTEEKDYDIKDILSKAKNNQTKDDKERSLDAINKLLARIDAEKDEDDTDIEQDTKDIENLMNTLTSTLALQKLSDKELSESIMPELSEKTQVTKRFKPDVELNDGPKKDDDDDNTDDVEENANTLDTSFYTNSNQLKRDDLDTEIRDDEEEPKKNIVGIILLTLLIAIVLGAIIYYFMHS